MLKLECKRAFGNPLFYISLLIGCALAVWHFIGTGLPQGIWISDEAFSLEGKGNGMDFPPNVFNRWIGGDFANVQPYLYFLILPILAVLPYGASYLSDLKSGYIKMLVIRADRRSYFCSKALAVFLSGGVAVILPMLLNLFLTATVLPALLPQVVTRLFPIQELSLWGDLYFAHPWVYIGIFLFIIFIFGGLFATLSLVVSRFSDNRFLVLIFPFLFMIFLNALAGFFYCSAISPLYFLRPTQPALGVSPWIMLSEALILLALVVFFARKGNKEDIF